MATELDAIHNAAKTAANQTLDFLRASALFAAGRFAIGTRAGRTRQQTVLSRYPPLVLIVEKFRHGRRDACRTQHLRPSDRYQHAAFGMAGKTSFKLNGTHLIVCASVVSLRHVFPFFRTKIPVALFAVRNRIQHSKVSVYNWAFAGRI